MLFALLISASLAQALPSCTDFYLGKTLADGKQHAPQICELLAKPGASVYKRYPDGTVLPNANLVKSANYEGPPKLEIFKQWAELSKLETASPAQKLAVRKLTLRLRDLLLLDIQGDTQRDRLSPLQKNLIDRISKMHISLGATTGRCNSLWPNSAFDEITLTLKICKNMLNFPVEILLPIIAHEFSHATDPCFFYHYQIRRERLAKVIAGDFSDLKACGANDDDLKRVRELSNDYKDDRLMQMRDGLTPLFAACGLAISPQTLSSADSIKQGPFYALENCGDQTESTSFQQALNKRSVFADHVLRRVNGTTKSIAIRDPFGGDLKCSRKSTETYADFLGAKLTSHYLQKFGKTMDPKKLQDLLYDHSSDICNYGDHQSADYPSNPDRLKTLLVFPEIAAAVRCDLSNETVFCGGVLNSPISTKKASQKAVR